MTASSHQTSLTKKDLIRIRKVQLKMESLATSTLAGLYKTAFKGKGMEFQEVREFQTGDEVRAIDWNVTARMGAPYVKLFKEERELTVYLMMDISSSTLFASKGSLKRDVLSEIGAAIAFSGIKNQDQIGLILFSDQIEHHLHPAKGIKHVLRIIRDLMTFQGKHQKTNLEHALAYFGKIQKKRSVLFLLSDFLDTQDYSQEIALVAKNHDIIAISIQDPLENEMPRLGLVQMNVLEENRPLLLDTSSHSLNTLLKSASQESLKKAEISVEKAGGVFTTIYTNESYLLALKKLFARYRYKKFHA